MKKDWNSRMESEILKISIALFPLNVFILFIYLFYRFFLFSFNSELKKEKRKKIKKSKTASFQEF